MEWKRSNRVIQGSLGPLTEGACVVIIGGGPGGASCGIALKRLAAAMNRSIRVVLYEGKHFAAESHYNQCVGVLSPPIDRILEEELGVAFPKHLVQRSITAYVLHGEREQILLEDEEAPSYAVRRVQFDAYLLDQARACGVEVIQSRVTDLEFHADRVVVYSESVPQVADVVVAAFGLDHGSAHALAGSTSYRQPRFLDSIVTKIHPPEEFMHGFGEHIHAYLPPWPQVEFGAITPKGNHLTINVAGARVDANWMDRFLAWEPVRSVLPAVDQYRSTNPKDLHYFKGRFPVSIASGFYGDRYVVVGDAAGLVRAFKGKGVNSACLSGLWAAESMLSHGISRAAFAGGYAQACAETVTDLPYGRAVRLLAIVGANQHLLDPLIDVARCEPVLRTALFHAVSGHCSYRTIAGELLRPAVAVQLAAKLCLSWKQSFGNTISRSSLEPASTTDRGLQASEPGRPDAGFGTVKRSK
jgi:flavin-dependent dehydrogenase